MNKKNNLVQVRLSDRMDEWLNSQCDVLGMNKSEVIRFWLQNSMLTFDKSVEVARDVAQTQLRGQMSIKDVLGGETDEKQMC